MESIEGCFEIWSGKAISFLDGPFTFTVNPDNDQEIFVYSPSGELVVKIIKQGMFVGMFHVTKGGCFDSFFCDENNNIFLVEHCENKCTVEAYAPGTKVNDIF